MATPTRGWFDEHGGVSTMVGPWPGNGTLVKKVSHRRGGISYAVRAYFYKVTELFSRGNAGNNMDGIFRPRVQGIRPGVQGSIIRVHRRTTVPYLHGRRRSMGWKQSDLETAARGTSIS